MGYAGVAMNHSILLYVENQTNAVQSSSTATVTDLDDSHESSLHHQDAFCEDRDAVRQLSHLRSKPDTARREADTSTP